jgi:hypothetical protein
MANFSACLPVVEYLRSREGRTVEEVLEQLQRDANEEYRERHRQLAAIRWYLHDMLWRCTDDWKNETRGPSNFQILFDQINHRMPAGTVQLITFNYDCLIEHALEKSMGIRMDSIPAYISDNRYNLAKLHGSINWAHDVDIPTSALADKNAWQVARQLIQDVATLEIDHDSFNIATNRPIALSAGTRARFPAIAIPLQNKDSFECPAEQIKRVFDVIPKVTKLLLVGWRATETPFLQMLKDRLANPKMLVVADGLTGANETINNLFNFGINVEHASPSERGFSQFVVSREAEPFLQD